MIPTLANIKRTSEACPAQWEGTTTDGCGVYIRYRWGRLRCEVDGDVIYHQIIGDGYDGDLENQKMAYELAEVLVIPQQAWDRWDAGKIE